MLVFALILLFFANHQPLVRPVRHVVHERTSRTATIPAVFLVGMFMALFVVYGFDTAGTFGEETVDASRQAPRGVLSVDLALGHRRRDLPARGDPVVQGHRRRDRRRARRSASRSPTTIKDNLHVRASAGSRVGDLYLVVILIAVFVCTLAIQGATRPADVLDGPRPAPAARRGLGSRQPDASDAGQRRRSRSASSPRSRSS